MRGKALQSLMDGSAGDWPDDVFVQISESQTGRAVRTSRWKYAVRAPGGSASSADSYYEDFLYDLEKDPHERNNLVRDPALADLRAELGERLKRRMRHAGEAEPGILPAKDV
jgi:arylsulfatase A-like enzyme